MRGDVDMLHSVTVQLAAGKSVQNFDTGSSGICRVDACCP